MQGTPDMFGGMSDFVKAMGADQDARLFAVVVILAALMLTFFPRRTPIVIRGVAVVLYLLVAYVCLHGFKPSYHDKHLNGEVYSLSKVIDLPCHGPQTADAQVQCGPGQLGPTASRIILSPGTPENPNVLVSNVHCSIDSSPSTEFSYEEEGGTGGCTHNPTGQPGKLTITVQYLKYRTFFED